MTDILQSRKVLYSIIGVLSTALLGMGILLYDARGEQIAAINDSIVDARERIRFLETKYEVLEALLLSGYKAPEE